MNNLLLTKVAPAKGEDVIFAEVHPDPDNTKSDGTNMLK